VTERYRLSEVPLSAYKPNRIFPADARLHGLPRAKIREGRDSTFVTRALMPEACA
jgi:hypothetical protein